MNLHYGENSKDPLRKIRFYGKADINHAISLEKNQVCLIKKLKNVSSSTIERKYTFIITNNCNCTE
jgi:hypothetical protein